VEFRGERRNRRDRVQAHAKPLELRLKHLLRLALED
jgi:hypothetical protein